MIDRFILLQSDQRFSKHRLVPVRKFAGSIVCNGIRACGACAQRSTDHRDRFPAQRLGGTECAVACDHDSVFVDHDWFLLTKRREAGPDRIQVFAIVPPGVGRILMKRLNINGVNFHQSEFPLIMSTVPDAMTSCLLDAVMRSSQ